jgi:hypothetical protein
MYAKTLKIAKSALLAILIFGNIPNPYSIQNAKICFYRQMQNIKK